MQAECQAIERDGAAVAIGDLAQSETFDVARVLVLRLDARQGDLERRLAGGEIREVIVATNFTNEGEATAHYINEMLKGRDLRVTRIARGVPVGGELEYVDTGTLAQAFAERRPL